MPNPIPLRAAASVWFKIALLSFGGPAAQIGLMQRLIVDEKGWLDQARFNHALNFCMLLPGPEAQQLAAYIGWLLHGVRGGLIAGTLFVLPGALVMLCLGLLYVTLGQATLVEGLLFGLKCAVLAIVIQALARMSGKVVQGTAATILAVAAFLAMFLFSLPFPVVVIGAGVLGLVLFSDAARTTDQASAPLTIRPVVPALALVMWLAPLVVLWLALGRESVWTELAGFFSLVASLSFGGAYAVLAWVAQFAAESRNWLSASEMLDGLGLAETTPGPLILVTQFVGFLAAWRQPGMLEPLLAGSLGAMLTTWVIFAPSFLWVFLLAPRVEALRHNPRVAGALRGVTAAVVGVIANLALWFAVRLLFSEHRPVDSAIFNFDWPLLVSIDLRALVLVVLAALMLFVFRLGLITTIALMAGIGLLLQWIDVT